MSFSINNYKRNFLLSSLLPYAPSTKKDGQILTGLQEYTLLLTGAERAVEALQERKFEKFDALVKENMCQVRAIKIAMATPSLLQTIVVLQQKLSNTGKQLKSLSSSFGKTTTGNLEQILEEENLHVMLTEDELFLIQSYLLTITKIKKLPKPETPLLGNNVTAPKNLQTLGKVSVYFTNALVKGLCQKLSVASVKFVQQCAQELPGSVTLIPTVSDEYCVDKRDSRSLPFFFVNDILTRQALVSKIPLVMHLEQIAQDQGNRIIRQISLLFIPTIKGYQRSIVPLSNELNSPALVVCGFMQRNFEALPSRSNTIDELLCHDMIDIILMNSADHRQSHDPLKEEQLQSMEAVASYRAKAVQKGCSFSNPSLFFIHHAFCGAVRDQGFKRKVEIANILISSCPQMPKVAVEKIIEYEDDYDL